MIALAQRAAVPVNVSLSCVFGCPMEGEVPQETVLFRPRDIGGVWPMVRHYFLSGPKPLSTGQYNPLQKLAYTSTLAFGLTSVLTGLVMFKAAQFSTLGWWFGGYHNARLIHFLSMCGLLAFIPGHLIMVAVHGWDNFMSMVTGWKRRPDYSRQRSRA